MTLNFYYGGYPVTGSLFWDDGESELDFMKHNFLVNNYEMTDESITAQLEDESMESLFSNKLEKIRIIGIDGIVSASLSGFPFEVTNNGNVHEIILDPDFTIG